LEGISQVTKALSESGVAEALQAMMNLAHSPGARQSRSEMLAAFKRYLLAAQGFNGAARAVVSILELQPLEEPQFWATDNPGEIQENVMSVYRTVVFTVQQLPKLAKLIRQETFPSTLKGPDGISRDALLTLILPEGANESSRPQRLVDALTAVTLLYEAVAAIENQPDNTLSILGCDSGSDKSFDFLGAAKLIENVRELVLSLYDRVVFYRELKVARSLELMASSLPILEKVSNLEQNKSLGPEQAEIIRRKITEGAGKLLSCGAIIPEMTKHSNFEPRQLMAPEPKLLTSGAKSEMKQNEELTNAEKEQLDELLRKSGRSSNR